jgi:DNA-binding CsgD family transcriptional regulator/N-acetylneuraminic acid mutarotase
MPELNDLSEREQEILYLVATGASNKEIARALYISANTVKVHLRNIFTKIEVASRTEAAMFAVSAGLVDPAVAARVNGQNGGQAGTTAGTPAETAPGLLGQAASVAEAEPFYRTRWFMLAGVVLLVSVALLAFYALRSPGAAQPSPAGEAVEPAQPRWQTLAALPTPRQGLAVAAYENLIYTIGGETSEGVTGRLESYDPISDEWTPLAAKPLPVSEVGAALIGGRIYVPGGRTASGSLTDALEIYDPRADRWEQGPPLPVALSGYALAALEGKLYLFGGWDGNRVLDSVFAYNPDTEEWLSRAAMPTARAYAGAGVSNGKIYVLGGSDGEQDLAVTEIYLPDRDDAGEAAWESGQPLPEARSGMGVASIAEIIHVFGGQADGQPVPSLLVHFPQREGWQTVGDQPGTPGAGLGLVSVGEYLYALGGEADGKLLGTNLAYRAVYTLSFPVIVK